MLGHGFCEIDAAIGTNILESLIKVQIMCLAFRTNEHDGVNCAEIEDGENLNLGRKLAQVDIYVQNAFILLRFPLSHNPSLSVD